LDEESDPHAGGRYSFEWTSYLSSFQTYVIDVRRFIPLTPTDRIGLRMQTTFTHSSPVEDVPFFLYPFIGGSDTVRGMSHYRFRDRNALVLNAEYRRPLAGFLDMVAFADAGRVFTKSTNLGLQNLHPAVGGGLRVKFGRSVFFGIDVGFSGERAKVSFRSDHLF
jgi:hemolysin activation/secretion protein